MNIEAVTGVAENPLDVGRKVAERVARTAPISTSGIDETATVGVDETAQEKAGVVVDKFLLPVGKNDLAFVLLAFAVLGKEEGPALGAGRDVVAIALPQMATT
ncbi:MAG TPA: hypothetical protein VH275_04015 [Solirubrobacterales bacterium]|nr:hypothetical protein [Solirubrobacterales bacterium]